MNPLSTETGLLTAAVVPVAVIGWSILFSVEAARRGPAWSLRHLEVVARIMGPLLALGIVAILVVRPVWIGLGATYPVAVALLMVAGRRRQLATVKRDMGFGEVQPAARDRLLARLRPGLIVVGVSSLLLGTFLAAIGVLQGWVVAALAPIAGLALMRSKSDRVGSVVSP